MAWNNLLKKPSLSQRPQLTQGLATHAEERDLELAFKNLRDLEDHCKKLYKEERRHEECANGLQRLERKMSSDLSNSPLCREYEDSEDLRKIAEDYQSVVYQLGTVDYLTFFLSEKTYFLLGMKILQSSMMKMKFGCPFSGPAKNPITVTSVI